MSEYKVYSVIYRSPHYGLAAVAVSSETEQGAKARLRDHRPCEIIDIQEIEGRKPEWEQDRIEGTVDLLNPMKAPPQADTREAEAIRASNKGVIARRDALSNEKEKG